MHVIGVGSAHPPARCAKAQRRGAFERSRRPQAGGGWFTREAAACRGPLRQARGVGDAFRTFAGPDLRRVALPQRDDAGMADLPPADHARLAWGRALGRDTLDALQPEQARAAGATVFQPRAVQAVLGTAGAWHGELHAPDSATPLRLRAAVVVDARGPWQALPTDGAAQRLGPVRVRGTVPHRVGARGCDRRAGVHLDAGDGIFRIGTDAGQARPILGEGMGMALQSAALPGAVLVSRSAAGETLPVGAAQAGLQRRHAAPWRQAFASRLRPAAALAGLAMRPSAAKALTGVVRAWPALLARRARWGGKVRFPEPPAEPGSPPATGPRAPSGGAGRAAPPTTREDST